jgi:hypothetical protein
MWKKSDKGKNMLENNNKMNIEKKAVEFTKDQFLALMKMVYLGNWMANATRNGGPEDPQKEEYNDIENYIFSHAKQFGLGEYVDDEDCEKYKRVFPTRKFEEETDVEKLREEYDDHTFWEELAGYLGDRDFYKKYSGEEIERMSQDDRFIKLQECIIKWEEELEKEGIDRLNIIEKNIPEFDKVSKSEKRKK